MTVNKQYIEIPVQAFDSGKVEEKDQAVVIEAKMTLSVNGGKVVSFMCLPQRLEELAAGFLFAEGFIENGPDISDITVDTDAGTIDVRADIVEGSVERFSQGRTLLSGCGGGVSGADIERPSDCMRTDASSLGELVSAFQKHSSLYTLAGGVHTAAIAAGGNLEISDDDIGRHNAVDKVIGHALLTRYDCSDKVLIVTGRVSSEIAIKTIVRKIPVLVSLSSPTSLALRLAEEYFLTVIGRARTRRFKIYTHPERVLF
jgi:FdhD protein